MSMLFRFTTWLAAALGVGAGFVLFALLYQSAASTAVIRFLYENF